MPYYAIERASLLAAATIAAIVATLQQPVVQKGEYLTGPQQ